MLQAKSIRTLTAVSSMMALLFFSATQASEIGDQLSQAFRVRISYLDRELMTFRYETKEEFEPKTLADIKGRLRFKTGKFFKKGLLDVMAAGPGAYVAIDPYTSRDFGGSDPQLYVLSLKKGTSILDLNTAFSASEHSLIKNAHDQLQCKHPGETLITEMEMNFFSLRNSATQACRDLAIEVVTALKVQAIMYSYSASNSLTDCRYRSVAFNVISPSAIDFNKLAFYSNSSFLESYPLSSLIKSIFDEASNDFQAKLGRRDSLFLPLTFQGINSANEQNYADWKAKNILNCGPKWSVESDQTNFMEASAINFKVNFQDLEIQDLILKFKQIFTSKSINNYYFSISGFYVFAKALFLASGLPDDEELFKKWNTLKSRQYFDAAARTEFLGLYGTDISLIDLVQKQDDITTLINSMTLDEIKNIDFFPRVLHAVGLNDGYQTYIINEFNSFQGGVLILSSDTKLNLSERLALSKDHYKAALKTCIDIYANDQISYEDAQKTDCRMLP